MTQRKYKTWSVPYYMADAMAGFDASSTDPLLNKAVQNFDFTAVVNAFDQASGANTTFMHWSPPAACWRHTSPAAIPRHWAVIWRTSTGRTAASPV